MKDYFGRDIQVGDLVVYGKSSREKPIGVGRVQSVEQHTMVVMGLNSSKPGEIKQGYSLSGYNERVIILPENYDR